jgi:hypothetical protein
MTGPYDFIMRLDTGSIREYFKILNELLLKYPNDVDIVNFCERNNIHKAFYKEILENESRKYIEHQLRSLKRLQSLDIGSLVYYDIKKYI